MINPLYQAVLEQLQTLASSGVPAIVGIDGRCAAGKTTLAVWLADRVACNVLHMDDFFLPVSQRLDLPGGHMDYSRLRREVLDPLRAGKDISLHAFNCRTQSMKPAAQIPFKPITILEGSYSMHPFLQDYYAYRVFIDVKPDIQQERILQRSGAAQWERFRDIWILAEEHYFAHFNIATRCDAVLN